MATSVAGLGIGDYDGQKKIISYGAAERQEMHWNATNGLWVSNVRPSIKFKSDWGTGLQGSGTWAYMTGYAGNKGQVGQAGFGWTPQAIHRADAAYAAGLVLYEKIDYLFWVWTAADDLRIATVYYDLAPDDVMSGVISTTAGSHLGTVINGEPGIRRFKTTGWVVSGIPTPTKAVLAPHVYSRNFGAALTGTATLEFFTSFVCWVGDPTP